MAPNASVANTVIHTNGLAGSDQSIVGSRMAMQISTPPIVGVPVFFRVRLRPVVAHNWPIWNSRSFWIT